MRIGKRKRKGKMETKRKKLSEKLDDDDNESD
jgi:hypothetical protein